MPPKETPKAEKPKEQSLKKRSDISVLKYDKYSYANFFKFEKELEEVAGYEFGDLFSFSKTGRYTSIKIPTKRTVENLIQDEKVNFQLTSKTKITRLNATRSISVMKICQMRNF